MNARTLFAFALLMIVIGMVSVQPSHAGITSCLPVSFETKRDHKNVMAQANIGYAISDSDPHNPVGFKQIRSGPPLQMFPVVTGPQAAGLYLLIQFTGLNDYIRDNEASIELHFHGVLKWVPEKNSWFMAVDLTTVTPGMAYLEFTMTHPGSDTTTVRIFFVLPATFGRTTEEKEEVSYTLPFVYYNRAADWLSVSDFIDDYRLFVSKHGLETNLPLWEDVDAEINHDVALGFAKSADYRLTCGKSGSAQPAPSTPPVTTPQIGNSDDVVIGSAPPATLTAPQNVVGGDNTPSTPQSTEPSVTFSKGKDFVYQSNGQTLHLPCLRVTAVHPVALILDFGQGWKQRDVELSLAVNSFRDIPITGASGSLITIKDLKTGTITTLSYDQAHSAYEEGK